MASTIIRRNGAFEDDGRYIEDDAQLPASGPVTVSLSRMRTEMKALVARGGVGLRLSPDESIDDVKGVLRQHTVPLIEVRFDKFGDGRGYTLARLLRSRVGYHGELRAVGDVLPDQLLYLARCGFDSFALKAGKSVDQALAAFHDFSVFYQPAEDQPQPLWRSA